MCSSDRHTSSVGNAKRDVKGLSAPSARATLADPMSKTMKAVVAKQ